MPKRKKATCPECGGRKFGRGFNHHPGCSLAKSSGARTRKRSRRDTKSSGDYVGNGIVAQILRLPVEDLIEVRRAIDAALSSRQGEVKRTVQSLRQLLRS